MKTVYGVNVKIDRKTGSYFTEMLYTQVQDPKSLSRSKTTHIIGSVGGTGVDPYTSKISMFFPMLLALISVCQFSKNNLIIYKLGNVSNLKTPNFASYAPSV